MQDGITLREFRVEDCGPALALWSQTEGVAICEGDEPREIADYLARNPGLSRVAEREGRLVAAVLCGHDGRRGLIYHLAVAPEARGSGIGKRLVEDCVRGLRPHGIRRVFILVEKENQRGLDFWKKRGFEELADASILGLTVS